MTSIVKHCLVGAIIALVITGCKKNDDPPPSRPHVTFPAVTTSPVSNITATTADVGGTIVDDMGAPVTGSGFCWSKTNPNPTIADDTIKTSVTSGSFTGQLKNLSSVTTYYVRAYAHNSAGVGYGKVVSFNSLNKAPEVFSTSIFGRFNINQRVSTRYVYRDAENDAEDATSFQWYIANDTTGSPVIPVSNATLYTIQPADERKFLRVGVTPKAKTGTSPGTESLSAWEGPIAGPLTVTFLYNGFNVTYNVIVSTTTQREWLDRNLGAPNTPTGVNDFANEGDLFQWGRPADGHQLINRAATTIGTTAVNGVTNTLSTIDVPGHSDFILTTTDPFDWHVPQSNQLWQVTGGINNVCPTGWHVPTTTEWEAENLGNAQDAFNKLKITMGGQRFAPDGKFSLVADNGAYWTSSIFTGVNLNAFSFQFITGGAAGFKSTQSPNASGLSVRCIRN